MLQRALRALVTAYRLPVACIASVTVYHGANSSTKSSFLKESGLRWLAAPIRLQLYKGRTDKVYAGVVRQSCRITY